MSDANYSEQLTFRETKDILTILHRLASKEGQQLGIFIRTNLRRQLRTRQDLTDQEKKALGVNGEAKKENT